MPGGGGNIAMMATARAAPDGYTLLAATSNIVTNISLYAKIGFDPNKDFAPISLMCSSPHVLVVHPSLPAQNARDLIALAKAEPGKYSFASAGRGTPAHPEGVLFHQKSRVPALLGPPQPFEAQVLLPVEEGKPLGDGLREGLQQGLVHPGVVGQRFLEMFHEGGSIQRLPDGERDAARGGQVVRREPGAHAASR